MSPASQSNIRLNGIRQAVAQRNNAGQRRYLALLGALVAVATAVALMVPAISMTRGDLTCGQEEHQHTDACYEQVLICGYDDSGISDSGIAQESDQAGASDASEEAEPTHQHSAECYERLLICEKPEHVHTDACYANQDSDQGNGDSGSLSDETSTQAGADGQAGASNGQEGAAPEETSGETGQGDQSDSDSTNLEVESADSTQGGEATDSPAGQTDNSSQTDNGSEAANADTSLATQSNLRGGEAADSDKASSSAASKSTQAAPKVAPDERVITAHGEDFVVIATYAKDAKLPQTAALQATEIPDTDDSFQGYAEQAEAALDWNEEARPVVRLFDITIVDENDPQMHYEPAEGATVDVRVEFVANAEEAKAVADTAEKAGANQDGKAVDGEASNGADVTDNVENSDNAEATGDDDSDDASDSAEGTDLTGDTDEAASSDDVNDLAADEGVSAVVNGEGAADDASSASLDPADQTYNIVHFGDEVEVLQASSDETSVSFEAQSFSVYAVVSSGATSNLGGKTYAIVNTYKSEAVLNRTQAVNGGTRLSASGAMLDQNNGTTYVIGDEIAFWTFTQVPGSSNRYYIQDSNGRYLQIIGEGTTGLSSSPQPITVSTANDRAGKVRLSQNGYALNAWNGKVSDGFGGGYWNDDSEYFTLFEANQVVQNWAYKKSLVELVAMSEAGNPVQDVMVYTRMENATQDGYDYYAVAADGSLVQVHDIGDTIGWTSLEASTAHLEWSFTVHKSSSTGETNGYFDFQSEESGQYLIPTPTGILKDDDPSDARDLGVNLDGWTAGEYGSTIERWDAASHSYIGYAYDAASHKLVPATNGAEELEFMFAVANVEQQSTQNKLHEVATLDGKSKGVTIKMYDFDANGRLYQNSPPRSYEMSQVIGTNGKSLNSTNKNGIGYANTGLVSATLDANGLPTATQSGKSLGELFNDEHLKSDASNLFVKQTYDETGYFSYDSSANYAYLDQANDKFILYREVAAPEMENKGTPSSEKGNFFPFDSLEALAASGSVYADRSVLFDGDLNRLPASHPQYGEKLYKIPYADRSDWYNSYYFGMTMEADFYQGPDGKDEKGNDTIFEFNGDDDMWLYIDGLLVLDIGGCHAAVNGTINFSTGEVKISGVEGHTTDMTIRELFKNNNRLPNGNPWNEAEAAKWFDGDTFADYTQHSFKMFYLERGSYASNLKVNFNLLTVEPGTFVLEKKLPDNVQSAYGDSLFAYQVFTVENGQKHLYVPPAATGDSTPRYVTYEGTGERVVPEGQTESAGYKPTYELDGKTYENVYFLKPGQAIVLPVPDKGVEYYVREIGIDTDVYKQVNVNGAEVPITLEDSAYGQVENLSPTSAAVTSVDTVQNRGRVTYENVPKEERVHNLRLTKVIDSPVDDPDAFFRFDVQLESNATGQLVPYNQGKYYIVKTDAQGDHYYKYEGSKLVPSQEPVAYTSGINGAIDHIQAGYTVLIKGLLAGTDFKVTENLSPSEMPEGYVYVKTDVEHAGAADLEGSQGTIQASTVSTPQAPEVAVDALVTITNRPTGLLRIQKTWQSGDFVTAHGDVYVALYKKTESGGETTLTLVDGSAKKLEYNEATQTYGADYYLPGADLANYEIREVNVTLDNQGNVTAVNSYVPGGATITISGETTDTSGQGTVSNTYYVTYAQGQVVDYTLPADSAGNPAKDGKTRTDTVTNALPKVSLYKVNEATGNAKRYLSGAVFALETQEGTPVHDAAGTAVTFESDADGKLFADKYFSDGTYYLRETTAPAGYNMLPYRIVLTVSNGVASAKMETPGTALYADQLATDATAYKFEIPNNPGVELPNTGGPGVGPLYAIGALLVLCGIGVLALRRRCARKRFGR